MMKFVIIALVCIAVVSAQGGFQQRPGQSLGNNRPGQQGFGNLGVIGSNGGGLNQARPGSGFNSGGSQGFNQGRPGSGINSGGSQGFNQGRPGSGFNSGGSQGFNNQGR